MTFTLGLIFQRDPERDAHNQEEETETETFVLDYSDEVDDNGFKTLKATAQTS